MISKIQWSWRQFRDVTVIWNFRTSLETNLFGPHLSFRRPFTPNSFFGSMLPRPDWVGVPKLTLSQGAGNPRYATAFDAPLLPTHSSHLCCHERAGWGRQNWLCPRAQEILGTPLVVGGLVPSKSKHVTQFQTGTTRTSDRHPEFKDTKFVNGYDEKDFLLFFDLLLIGIIWNFAPIFLMQTEIFHGIFASWRSMYLLELPMYMRISGEFVIFLWVKTQNSNIRILKHLIFIEQSSSFKNTEN